MQAENYNRAMSSPLNSPLNPQLVLTLNGAPLAFTAPFSVAQLVESQGWAGKRIAVERNGSIVPKSQHASTLLNAGDRVEIVVAVGGG